MSNINWNINLKTIFKKRHIKKGINKKTKLKKKLKAWVMV